MDQIFKDYSRNIKETLTQCSFEWFVLFKQICERECHAKSMFHWYDLQRNKSAYLEDRWFNPSTQKWGDSRIFRLRLLNFPSFWKIVVGVCELNTLVSRECSDGSSGTKMKEVLGCGRGGRSRRGWTVVADEDESGGGCGGDEARGGMVVHKVCTPVT